MYISELMGGNMCSEGEEIDLRTVAGFVYTHAAYVIGKLSQTISGQ